MFNIKGEARSHIISYLWHLAFIIYGYSKESDVRFVSEHVVDI